jgi:hypothetical protein
MSKEQIDKLVAQLEAEMRAAAKQLEFERAAALRDEIQDIRLRVLEEDASTAVLKAAERASTSQSREAAVAPSKRMAAMRSGERRGRRALREAGGDLEVTSVTVLDAGEEPADTLAASHDGHGHDDDRIPDPDTAGDWLPGLKDEHEGDDAGWMARWLDRPTWDVRVTPNVIKRTGERPRRGRRR